MIAYPGRTFGQLYHRFVKGNALAAGAIELGDRTIELSAITAPVLVFAGATDGIAPGRRGAAGASPCCSGAREVRFEIVPGGHLGMLTGRAARGSTWRVLDEWIGQWSSDDAPAPTTRRTKKTKKPARRTPAPKTARRRRRPKKPPAVRKTTTHKAPAKDATPAPDAIGANPTRRYGSARIPRARHLSGSARP